MRRITESQSEHEYRERATERRSQLLRRMAHEEPARHMQRHEQQRRHDVRGSERMHAHEVAEDGAAQQEFLEDRRHDHCVQRGERRLEGQQRLAAHDARPHDSRDDDETDSQTPRDRTLPIRQVEDVAARPDKRISQRAGRIHTTNFAKVQNAKPPRLVVSHVNRESSTYTFSVHAIIQVRMSRANVMYVCRAMDIEMSELIEIGPRRVQLAFVGRAHETDIGCQLLDE